MESTNADALIFDNSIREDDVAATVEELKTQGFAEFIFSGKASNKYNLLALFQEAAGYLAARKNKD
ncbi:MAG: hypothetical protein LBJ96_03675 [Holosporaceae bacterium]|nr:hypothetical protein [Holosporaceae bacterium]